MRVLITGGAGYIGSVTARQLLRDNHSVRVLDSLRFGGHALPSLYPETGFEFQLGDIRDPQSVQRALENIDAVVHLAAIVGDPACARDPALATEVNLEASINLFETSCSAGVKRFLFASTCSNYGKMADKSRPVDERTELSPISHYARTKVAFEQFLISKTRTCAIDAAILRLATVFGISPRMRFDLTVNEFTKDLATKAHLTVFGEQFWRPYVHVRDVARAFSMLLEKPSECVRGNVFNLGDNRENYTKAALVQKIRDIIGGNTTLECIARDEDPRDYRVDFTRIQSELGFRITRTVDDGVREILSAIRQGVFENLESPVYRN